MEAMTRTMQQILAEEFDIMPRRLTGKERRRSVTHSPAGIMAAALAQRRLGDSTPAAVLPPGRAWEEGEKCRSSEETGGRDHRFDYSTRKGRARSFVRCRV